MGILNLRRSMVAGIIAPLTALVVPLAVPAQSSLDDPIWHRAVAIAGRNAGLAPLRMEMEIEQRNPNGDIVERMERVYEGELVDGEVSMRLVREVENGTEVPIADTRTEDGNENAETPFDPVVQDRLVYRRSAPVRVVRGYRCVPFTFRFEASNGTTSNGMACLTNDGVPVEIEFTFEPLPRFVSELNIRVDYQVDPDRWFATQIYSSGEGGLLFVRRTFESRMTFSDYVRTGRGDVPAGSSR